MSDQTQSQEVKQYLLEQLDASKQAIQELNDDELKSVVGGMGKWGHMAIGAAASLFVPPMVSGLFGGGSSSQSQSQTTSVQPPAQSQSTTTMGPGPATSTTTGH